MSKPSRNSSQNNDFDVNALLSDVSNHARDMTTLGKKVECLEEKFGTHEQIAETLSKTAETAVKMQTMLAETFVKLLKNNKDIRDEFVKIINEADRDFVKSSIKRFGGYIWTLFAASIGAILTYFLKK